MKQAETLKQQCNSSQQARINDDCISAGRRERKESRKTRPAWMLKYDRFNEKELRCVSRAVPRSFSSFLLRLRRHLFDPDRIASRDRTCRPHAITVGALVDRRYSQSMLSSVEAFRESSFRESMRPVSLRQKIDCQTSSRNQVAGFSSTSSSSLIVEISMIVNTTPTGVVSSAV